MRLFVALEIPEAVKEHLACVEEDVRAALPRGNWVAPADMHITLAFLGETDTDMVPVITEALETAADKTRALELQVAWLGAFPNLTRASVLWAGLSAKSRVSTSILGDATALANTSIAFPKPEKLLSLSQTVRTLLAKSEPPIDFDPKPFKPHITLARFKQHADCSIVEKMTIQPISMKLDSLVLFETVWLHGGGHRYESRANFRLH